MLSENPSKAVSDALRWEVRRGRVVKVARATYRATDWPRTTTHRIRTRVLALRVRAEELRGPIDDAWSRQTDEEYWSRFA